MDGRPLKEKDIKIVTKCVACTVIHINGMPLYTVTKTLQLMTNKQTSYCCYCSFKTKFLNYVFIFISLYYQPTL